MTDGKPASQEQEFEKRLSRRFNALVRRGGAAIFWERLWPKALPSLCVSGLFVSASWLGLWSSASPAGRAAGVFLYGVAAAAPFALKKTGSLNVTRKDAVRRLDDSTGEPGRPASMLDASLAPDSPEASKTIWTYERRRIWNEYGEKLKPGLPRPGISAAVYGAAAAITVGTITTGIMADGHRMDDLAMAFNWSAPPGAAVPLSAPEKNPLRVKAWIEPPGSIPDPVIELTDEKEPGGNFSVHKRSKVTVLSFDDGATVRLNGRLLEPQKSFSSGNAASDERTTVYEEILEEGGAEIVVEKGAQRLRWSFSVLPDHAPDVTIKSVAEMEGQDEKSLAVRYSAKDDYGVTGGEIVLTPRRGSVSAAAFMLPTAAFPAFPLEENGRVSKDKVSLQQLNGLTSHPLAGGAVQVKVAVQDALGQKAESNGVETVLPQRTFINPLNVKLAAIRRGLAEAYMDGPEKSGRAAIALSGDLKSFIEKNGGGIVNKQAVSILEETRKNLQSSQTPAIADQALRGIWDAMILLEADAVLKHGNSAAERRNAAQAQAIQDMLREQQELMDRTARQVAENLPELERILDEVKNIADKLGADMKKRSDLLKKGEEETRQNMKDALEKLDESLKQQDMTYEQKEKLLEEEKKRWKNALDKNIRDQERLENMKRAMENLQRDMADMQDGKKDISEDSLDDALEKLDQAREDLQNIEDESPERAQEKLEDRVEDMEDRIDRQMEQERSAGGGQTGESRETPEGKKQDGKQNAGKQQDGKQEKGGPQSSQKRQEKLDDMKKGLQEIKDRLEDKKTQDQKMSSGEIDDASKKMDKMQKDMEEIEKNRAKEQKNPEDPEDENQLPEGQNSSGSGEEEQDREKEKGPGGSQDSKGEQGGQSREKKKLRDLQEKMQKGSKDLGRKQQALQNRLENMMGRMQRVESDTGGMEAASEKMRSASRNLARGQTGQALPDQGKAIEGLREAAEKMLPPERKAGQGKGLGTGPSSGPAPGVSGRFNKDAGGSSGDLAGGAAGDIREAIRQRLADPALPGRDRQYYENLLNAGKPSPGQTPRP